MGRNVANAEKSLLKEFSRYKYDGESPFRTTKTREIFTQDISTELRFWEIVNFNELSKVEISTLLPESTYQSNSDAA